MLQRQRGLLVVKKQKEDQVSRCEAYIDGMETKLQVCQRRHEWEFRNSMVIFHLARPQSRVGVHSLQLSSNLFDMRGS